VDRVSVRRVAVVTGSRAEFGLLRWLLEDLCDDRRAALLLIVTGAHLSGDHGRTVDEIRAAGLPVAAEVDLDLGDDAPVAVARSVAAGVAGIAAALERLSPDVLVLLGDRYEVLAAAQAALLLRIPVAHIHGGEATEGAIDEAIRHAVTKMSHLHFAAAEDYRRRIVQLGEDPSRVWTVGALGLDSVERLAPMDDAELGALLGGWDPGATPLLVTYHPATLGDADPTQATGALLEALDAFPEHRVLATEANADTGGRAVNGALRAWAAATGDRARVFVSLGQRGYLSAMRRAGAVVGNSSSGILEAPALGVPTVNTGDRQRGRLRAPSVIDVGEDAAAIQAGIERALAGTWTPSTPYGTPGASARIREVLLTHPLDGLLRKRFHDLP
jgi:UDP-hydrolysing UDP-N-acetyl-D-glucosamine 2-epimerase